MMQFQDCLDVASYSRLREIVRPKRGALSAESPMPAPPVQQPPPTDPVIPPIQA